MMGNENYNGHYWDIFDIKGPGSSVNTFNGILYDDSSNAKKGNTQYNLYKIKDEHGSRYFIEIKATGVDPKDISVTVEGDDLKIKSLGGDSVRGYCIVNNFSIENIDILIKLGNEHDVNGIVCECNNGILEVVIPEKKKKVKSIKVN